MPEREILNPDTHHEKSDVNVRALLWSVAIFVVFAFITHGILYVMFHYFAEIARGQTNEPMTEIARPAGMSVPQTPRLQPFPNHDRAGAVIVPNANTPVTDMEEMRAAEENAQKNPAWLDQSKGQVRLPIEVAKQLVVQRGLAVNSGGSQP
jgi:hypothetical protein